jgi:ligand-binding sensor domain-containing protein
MISIARFPDIVIRSKTRHALSLIFVLCYVIDCSRVNAQFSASNFNNLFTEFESQKLNVTSITQDNQGFIWFGTFQGLFKFDGVSYQRYLPEANSRQSISDNQVTAIYNDSKGVLWVGTRNGLNRYNYLSNDFEHFKHDSANSNSLPNNEVLAIAEDNDGNLWIGTLNGGLSRMSPVIKNGRRSYHFMNFIHDENDASGLSSNIVFSIAFDQSGNGLIGTDNGLNIMLLPAIKDARISFKQFKNKDSDAGSIANNEVYKVFCDADNNVWLISQFGMVDLLTADEIAKETYRFRHFYPTIKQLTGGAIKSSSMIYVDSRHHCWLSTYENGLYRFTVTPDYQIRNMVNYFHDPTNSRSLANNAVSAVFESSDQCIWIGTAAGVSRWNALQEKFSVAPEAAIHFKNANVNGIAEDVSGNLWIGTADSDTLYVINRATGNLFSIALEDKKNTADRKVYVTSLLIAKDGALYAGTSYGVFILTANELDKCSRTKGYQPLIRHLRHNPGNISNSLISNIIICMDEDEQGAIWIGTGKGLNRLIPSTLSCERAFWNKASDEINPAYIIRHICVTNDGTIWVTTDAGLVSITAKNYATTSYSKKNGLSSLRLSFIHESADNKTLWLGSQQGLVSFNREKGEFQDYPAAVADLSVMAILEDHQRNLWISSQQGICRFNPGTGDVKKFTAQNGLHANSFNVITCYQSASGLFYFGSEKGFQAFYPDSITINTAIPPITITDFKLFNQSILKGDDSALKTNFLGTREMRLNYDQNFFSIDFAALSYEDATANSYAYQLTEIDKDWVSAGNSRTATYTNIPPGSYEFRVKGTNNHGVWNEAGATLMITITPPWWKTWWFYTLCTITVIGTLYALYRYRINQIKKVFSIRSKIARDLHDDIGSTLSSISLMSQLAKTGEGQKNKEEALFETISTASREAMELMSVIVWSVNPNNDKLSNILIRMREYASDTLEACNMEVNIILEDEARDFTISMEKRKDFYLIFKEAINNTAKYSKATHCIIRIKKENGKMIMTISDNGQGFVTEKLRSGNGLVNMDTRARSIGGNLKITSAPGEGTTVRLELPHAS